MKKMIEKFYDKVFLDKESTEEIPYANKQFMFWFSIISFSIVLFFILKDIIHNIQKIQA